MITWASFVEDFPEFGSTDLPNTMGGQFVRGSFNFWYSLGQILFNTHRWGSPSASATSPASTLIDCGLELFIAHNLVLDKQNVSTATVGGAPGISTGPVASKSINGVSVSYDTNAGLNSGDAHFNLTTYGTRLMFLANMVGAGGVQLGADDIVPGQLGWLNFW